MFPAELEAQEHQAALALAAQGGFRARVLVSPQT
jgi:hypothetical protein